MASTVRPAAEAEAAEAAEPVPRAILPDGRLAAAQVEGDRGVARVGAVHLEGAGRGAWARSAEETEGGWRGCVCGEAGSRWGCAP